MPRFFFHTADGSRDRDEIGTELPNESTARLHAVKFAGEVLSDEPDVLWNGSEFRVEVTDEGGSLMFTVVTRAVDGSVSE